MWARADLKISGINLFLLNLLIPFISARSMVRMMKAQTAATGKMMA